MKTAAAAAALLLAFATPAGAKIVNIRYDGVVSQGIDAHGLFGAPGVLDGSAFSAAFVLDDTLGDSLYAPPYRSSFGFLNLGSSMVVGATVRIGGRAFDLWCGGGTDYCDVHHAVNAGDGGMNEVSTSLGSFAVDATVVRLWDQFIGFDVASANPFLPDFDYHSRFTYDFQPGDRVGGELHISDRIEPFDGPGYDLQRVDARLMATSLSVYVPEPATWVSMILGFAAAGTVLRRRRAALSATAAG